MNLIDDLKGLAEIHDLCLTIYQPLRDAMHLRANAGTHLLAAAHSVDHLLATRGYDAESRKAFLRPILKLADEDWSTREGTIFIFRSPGFMSWDICPDLLNSTFRLSDSFFVLPLLQRAGLRNDFWLLTLSMKDVRLFRGTQLRFTEVGLPRGISRNLRDFEAFDVPDRDLESRSFAGHSMGAARTVRFGTTSMRENTNRYLHDYFRKLDRAIRPLVAVTGEPLILAGVERELAVYRHINTCSTLLDSAIQGSPDGLSNAVLHEKALHIMEEASSITDVAAQKQMAEAANRGLLIDDFSELLDAAREGRIERLFVCANSGKSDDLALDLLNNAVLSVIRNSGSVIVTAAPEVTGIAAAQARYRSRDAA